MVGEGEGVRRGVESCVKERAKRGSRRGREETSGRWRKREQKGQSMNEQ